MLIQLSLSAQQTTQGSVAGKSYPMEFAMSSDNHHYNLNKNVSDNNIINDLYPLCIDQYSFYTEAALEIDSQSLRDLFLSMARVGAEIVEFFDSDITLSKRPAEATELRPLIERLQHWYKDTEAGEDEQEPTIEFLEELVTIEERTLEIFRMAVKKVSNQQLAKELASKVASLQILHDRTKALTEKRKVRH